jgi:hypothetical protein
VRGKESGGVASPTCCAARSRSKSPSASGAERIRHRSVPSSPCYRGPR